MQVPGVVNHGLDREKEISGKRLHNRIWKDGKQLIGCGCPLEGVSACFNAAAESVCHFIGMEAMS